MPKTSNTKKKDNNGGTGKDDSHKRRNRVPISCTICRRRKVKCSKERPVCKGCEKTGVGHLCHYIEPVWAQPVAEGSNIRSDLLFTGDLLSETTTGSPEEQGLLIMKLKEKIKALERELYSGTSSTGSSPSNHPYNQRSLPLSTCASYNASSSKDYEVLNLGKKFDMLHIKSTTTVHLGPTSWLAIMKGDPYLRVLWAHIFKMRKQVEDFKFMVRQRQLAAQGIIIKDRVCPVSGKNASNSIPDPITASMCPVQHSRRPRRLPPPATETTVPTHEVDDTAKQGGKDKPNACPMSGRTSSEYGMKCPMVHSHPQTNTVAPSKSTLSTLPESNMVTPSNSVTKGCPLMIDGNSFMEPIESKRDASSVKKHLLDGEVKFLQKSVPSKSHNKSNDSNKRSKHQTSPEETRECANGQATIEEGTANGKNINELFRDDKAKTLELLLPTRQVLWLLIDRFFDILYVYIPFIDEESFRQEIKTIFGGEYDSEKDEETGNRIKLHIRNPVDFALIGTVCVLLRLSWLTLPKNSSNAHLGKNTTIKTYPEDMQKIHLLELAENEISMDLIQCVKQYINNNNDNDQLIKKSNLKVVQFAIFLKLFDQYSPEEKDSADGSDSQVFLGMIIHMAIRIGLHRDPDNFENFTNQNQRHLWRKLWFALVSMDVEQSVNLGCPRALETYLEFSDTKFPSETDFSADLKELTVIKLMKTQYQADLLLAKAMRVLLNVAKPARKYQIDHLIEELTRYIHGCFTDNVSSPYSNHCSSSNNNDATALPQLGSILINRTKNEPLYSSATRAYQFKLASQINMFIYLLNYILFVHFEPLGTKDIALYKIAKEHAQKALDAALEGYRNCTLFFDCNLDYFGPGADLITSPLLLLIGHRSIQFMVSLILRSRCGPYMRPAVTKENQQRDENDSKINKEEDKHYNEEKFGLNNVNNRNYDLQQVEIKDEEEPKSTTTFYNTDVDSGEILAKILLKHMENFHKLTDKLGAKYPYSWRMSKAVGFFVILLRKPVNIVKAIVKTDNVKHVENNTGFASNVLNSVPLVLNPDEVGFNINKKTDKGKEEEKFGDSLESQDQQSSLKRKVSTDIISKSSVSTTSTGFDSVGLLKDDSMASTISTGSTTNTIAASIPLSTDSSTASTNTVTSSNAPYQASDLFKGIPDFIIPNSQMLFDFNEVSLDQSINEIFNSGNTDILNSDNSMSSINNPINFNFSFESLQTAADNGQQQQTSLSQTSDENGEFSNDLLFDNMLMSSGLGNGNGNFDTSSLMNLNMNKTGFDFNVEKDSRDKHNLQQQRVQANNNMGLFNDGSNAFTDFFN